MISELFICNWFRLQCGGAVFVYVWMMKSRSVFVTMKKSLYQPLSLFWYFGVLFCVCVCLCVCWEKKLISSPFGRSVRTWHSLSFSFNGLSFVCSEFGRVFFYRLQNWMIYRISYWNWSWASTHSHSLCYSVILWNENIFFRCLRTHVFRKHKTRIEWAENVNVRFEFAVNYLLDDICAYILTRFRTAKIGHIQLAVDSTCGTCCFIARTKIYCH